MNEHGCAELRHEDGWVIIVCDCGADFGVFPNNQTAIDALIDHAVRIALTSDA